MAKDYDTVFEDLMSYDVFNLKDIKQSTISGLKNAIKKDPTGSISDALLDKIADTDKADILARVNQLRDDVDSAADLFRARQLQDDLKELDNEITVGGTAENFADRELDIIEDNLFKKKRVFGRQEQIAQTKIARQELFKTLPENDIQIIAKGKKISTISNLFGGVPEQEVRQRVQQLGFTIDEKDVIR